MSDHRVAMLITIPSLSFLHQLSIQSFLDHGHQVDIYAYGPVANLPRKATLRHAAKVLPRAEFDAIGDAQLAADRFRYLLLIAEEGVITAEPEICLLAPLEPKGGYLFGWQSEQYLGGEILALPRHSAGLAALVDFTADPNPVPPWAIGAELDALLAAQKTSEPVPARDQARGVWRSRALTHFLRESGEIANALPAQAFYPLPFRARDFLLARKRSLNEVTTADTMAVALYSEEIGRAIVELDKGLPKYWSPLSDLMRTHNILPRLAPIPGSGELPSGRWDDAPAVALSKPETAEPKAKDRPVKRPGKSAEPPAEIAVAPHVLPTSKPELDMPAPKVMIVTCMRNEGPFILEWIAYHRSIGIKNFVVYTNDCDDGTDTLLDLLEAKGVITAHRPNPFSPDSKAGDYQRAALWDAQEQPFVKDMDWIIPMDVDEFVNIHVGDGQFADLVTATPDANMISMVWRLFGNGFVEGFSEDFITEQFHHCAAENCRKPALAWGFKTAFKDIGAFDRFAVHRPKGPIEGRESDVRWYLGDAQLPPSYLPTGWRAPKNARKYDLVTLNHYALRSAESYLVKRQRGRVNHTDEDQGLTYWFRMNHNTEEDRSISRHLPAAHAEFSSLLEDADIALQHRACVAAHKTRIAELKALPDYQSLLASVTSERFNRMSTMLHHFGNGVFDPGPTAISDEFLEWVDRNDGSPAPDAAKIPWEEWVKSKQYQQTSKRAKEMSRNEAKSD